MVNSRSSGRFPPETSTRKEEKRRANPVNINTPTIIPAQAQAEATGRIFWAPFSKLLRSLDGVTRVFLKGRLTKNKATIDQKAAFMGDARLIPRR
jgi:hypothetical protein